MMCIDYDFLSLQRPFLTFISMPKPKEIQGNPEKGLNILCIDGGGVRGLSSLLLLQEIMLRVQRHEGRNTPVKPCDYFDVIAGVGTGAISACMLGRLNMPLDGAIESLERLMTDIFSGGKKLFGQGAFKTTKLKEAVIKVIREANKNTNEPLLDKDADQSTCKTLVFYSAKLHVVLTAVQDGVRNVQA
ncbi:unnamed protein product [Rhizoctonia solani]|uniref:PNPLA domain-containing protein n=1 Tax=Rhizoctonia solani TaxID=456999 RepID=A0A8H3A3K5_9AGAM|nr:unnamed protein product [Rhizoctonia solani]